MADIPTAQQITELASLLAPGLIISTIMNRAASGSPPDLKDSLVAYGLYSTGYFAAVSPFFHITSGLHLSEWQWKLCLYFVTPVFIGILLAYAYQHKILYAMARRVNLHLAHHLSASWDYAFEGLPDTTYILVTLEDGTRIAGRWAAGSFAASSKDERDLLISEMWKPGARGKPWTKLEPPRSVLICGRDIKSIELFGA